MEIKRFESDMMASNMYLLSENGHAVVIDPCRDTSPGSAVFAKVRRERRVLGNPARRFEL